jgi:hypothetical protein
MSVRELNTLDRLGAENLKLAAQRDEPSRPYRRSD